MNSINHKKGLKILRKILLKMRKERTEMELGRFLIQSSLSSSDDFGVQKSNVNTSLEPSKGLFSVRISSLLTILVWLERGRDRLIPGLSVHPRSFGRLRFRS